MSCSFCGKKETPNEPLKRCSRCKISSYCCVEHQKQDWAKHKLICGKVLGLETILEKEDLIVQASSSNDDVLRAW